MCHICYIEVIHIVAQRAELCKICAQIISIETCCLVAFLTRQMYKNQQKFKISKYLKAKNMEEWNDIQSEVRKNYWYPCQRDALRPFNVGVWRRINYRQPYVHLKLFLAFFRFLLKRWSYIEIFQIILLLEGWSWFEAFRSIYVKCYWHYFVLELFLKSLNCFIEPWTCLFLTFLRTG